jgi:hypothetical protein
MTATALAAVGSNANENGTLLISGTAVTASGTFVDFTGIPSWAKRVTVMFSGVSTNGTSAFLVQIGDSGGVETTGYTANSLQMFVATGTQVALFTSTAGYIIASNVAANLLHGTVVLTNVSSNNWVASSATTGTTGTAIGIVSAGSKTLSDTLTQVRITTVNGTDSFDAGTINIMWE